jgi:putative membrane protein
MMSFGDRQALEDLGDEPDYRFSLANERTFLAWIRTALAIMAAAVAVAQLVPELHLHGIRRELGAVLALVALAISSAAYPRWYANQRAMRLGQPLPHSRLLPLVGFALTVVAVAVVVIALVG